MLGFGVSVWHLLSVGVSVTSMRVLTGEGVCVCVFFTKKVL